VRVKKVEILNRGQMRRKTINIMSVLVLVASLVFVLVPWSGVGATGNSQMMNSSYFITASFEELPPTQYYLAISSTEGGSVTEPGEGVFTHNEGTVVYLAAAPDVRYRFDRWTGNVSTVANIESVATTITMNGNYFITAKFTAVGLSSIPGIIAPGSCFIATAAYGTPMAEEIQILREFRDRYLLTNPLGRSLVSFYYKVSPPIAEFITEHPSLKPIMRAGLLPVVAMSTVAVNPTVHDKAVMVGLLVLVSVVAVATWAIRRPRCRY
jgi:hypothetical protein